MNLTYADFEFLLSATLLVCAMFGMGTTLTVRDFINVARAPQGVLLVFAMQILITPLLAILLARVFVLPGGVAIGLLLVAAMPGGLFSNILTYLGRGNVALSVSATALCTLGCLVTTTFVLKTFGQTQLPDDFEMPAGRIVFDITFCLLLPLTLGMVVRRMMPVGYITLAKIFVRLSFALLTLLIAAGIASGRISVAQYGWRSPAALVVFVTLSIWICYALGMLVRMPLADSFTVAIEVVVRNAHLGVLLKAALFPASDSGADEVGNAVLYVILFYGVLSLGYGGFEVISKRMAWGVHSGRFARFAAESEN